MTENKPAREAGSSLFFPIILIAAGVVWLLSNLGLLPALAWETLLPLWPVILILLGINLIVRQAPRPFGTLLSALVGMIAVGLFVLVLLVPSAFEWLPAAGSAVEVSDYTLDYNPSGIERATINLNTGQWPVEIDALEAGDALVAGTIRYTGDVIEDKSERNGVADYRLDTRNNGTWLLNPARWSQIDDAFQPWEIGLSPAVPIDLTLDFGSGAAEADLSDLNLSALNLDGGSGRVTVSLPDGVYDLFADTGSGASSWQLPANGDGRYRFDSGSGSLTLQLPAGSQARIEIDTGSGAFNPDDRFTRVSGDNDNGVWETAGYAAADARLLIEIDSGSGSVRVEQPAGR